METIKLSTKGQIVLPKAAREAHGLKPGAELAIDYSGDEIKLRPVRRAGATRTYTVAEVAGFIKYDGPPLSEEDMKRAVEEDFKRRWHGDRN
jgi:AbrB family looped-hinge helix DNA binding protein